jgi:transcriptional antiterminator
MEKYRLNLTAEERNGLLKLIKSGKGSANMHTHARILLAVDENVFNDDELSKQLHVSQKTIQRVRTIAVLEGLEVALNRKKYTSTKRVGKLTGEVEAHLITLCCSTPPTGRSRWTLKLLADKLVELEIIDKVSSTTIQRTLKKTNLSLG